MFWGRGQLIKSTDKDSLRPAASAPANIAQTTGRLVALQREEAKEAPQVSFRYVLG